MFAPASTGWFICLLAGLLKKNETILMEPLSFGADPDPFSDVCEVFFQYFSFFKSNSLI